MAIRGRPTAHRSLNPACSAVCQTSSSEYLWLDSVQIVSPPHELYGGIRAFDPHRLCLDRS